MTLTIVVDDKIRADENLYYAEYKQNAIYDTTLDLERSVVHWSSSSSSSTQQRQHATT